MFVIDWRQIYTQKVPRAKKGMHERRRSQLAPARMDDGREGGRKGGRKRKEGRKTARECLPPVTMGKYA